MLGFPQTYPGLGTPTDSGTFAGNLNWFMKSWVWYGLFVISICLVRGRPRDNADTPILKIHAILEFPHPYPGLGNPTNSGTFSGNLNWFMKSWVWYGLNLIRQYLLHPRQAQNKHYAILGFPQTYPRLGTPTGSGTFAGILVIPWEYFISWFWYGLFVMNCCGAVVGVAVVFDIEKIIEVQKLCNARIPANVPRTWDS